MHSTGAGLPRLHAASSTSQPVHVRLVTELWRKSNQEDTVIVDGNSLDLANVAAVAKCRADAALPDDSSAVIERIEKSVRQLNSQLRAGNTVYGVNTGYGGSADVRCEPHEMLTLQRAFLQHLHYGVLPVSPMNPSSASLKEEWVRAAMLVRANSVARGHSAVRTSTIKALLTLLRHNIIPCIPTRGTISASGDLSPLSYIAGALEGNQHIYCWIGSKGSRRLVPANEALASANVIPVVFEPKEALGLVNGTAISCAAGSLVLSSMHNLLALSQLLTAMNVEAMLGTATSFAPFISNIRPHPGQAEVASTILSALQGSKLATSVFDRHDHALFQDRYSLRTVPQWLGPFIEDILLAHDQLTVEMNSTTDNPLIDPDTGDIYHGGNFQAVSVTTAMEKCRVTAQATGRMLFAQFTEMMNPATNRGLPPNLCADDPSTSFTMKGMDIGMAAYISELSFLANPVHSHVVSAEMGNQALNSLALISARYTDSTVDILTMICATALYGVCQALDLRAMMRRFEERWEEVLGASIHTKFGRVLAENDALEETKKTVWAYVSEGLAKTTTMDTKERFQNIMKGAKTIMSEVLIDIFSSDENMSRKYPYGLKDLRDWSQFNAGDAAILYNKTREEYFLQGDATPILGAASRRLYQFVRQTLKIPMHRGVVDHPTSSVVSSAITNGNGSVAEPSAKGGDRATDDEWRKKTIGHWISVIHEAIKSEIVMNVAVECLMDGMNEEGK